MGGSASKELSPAYEEATRCYSRAELKELEIRYDACLPPRDDPDVDPGLALEDFENFTQQSGPLISRLHHVLRKHNPKVNFDHILEAKVLCERSPKAKQHEFVYKVVCGSSESSDFVSRDELKTVLLDCILLIRGAASGCTSTSSAEYALAEALCTSAATGGALRNEPVASTTDGVGGANVVRLGEQITLDRFQRWCTQVPAVPTLMSNFLRPSEAGRILQHVPRLRIPLSTDESLLLMDTAHAWLLASMLQEHQREAWILLYNSRIHGAALPTFMGRCTQKGPALLVVRDKKGCLFGAFAAEPLRVHADFGGSFHTFVFQMLPSTDVYRPTGANEKFQYCAANFQSIENGIGFGHQEKRYALWINKDLTSGSSYPCRTFDSPCLSHSTDFEVDTIEVWEVSPPPVLPEVAGADGSVLDRFKEDRAVLQMAGRGGFSDGVR